MQFSHLEGQPLTVSSQTYGTADYNFSSAEGLVQAPASASTDNLYNEYYSRYVSEISNPNTRILTVKMLLNSSDINTFEFTDDDYFYFNYVRLLKFEDIPSVFQRYIIYKASGRAAVQLVSNQQLQQMLGTYEVQARGACMEYECNQGDHNFMGWPDESAYQSYKPYTALRR